MTAHAYLASRDVRHLAIHSRPSFTTPPGHFRAAGWVSVCDRASDDVHLVLVEGDDVLIRVDRPNRLTTDTRITKPVCKSCLHALSALHSASDFTPPAPPRPLPNIA